MGEEEKEMKQAINLSQDKAAGGSMFYLYDQVYDTSTRTQRHLMSFWNFKLLFGMFLFSNLGAKLKVCHKYFAWAQKELHPISTQYPKKLI